MMRTEAIALLVEARLASLGPQERRSILLDWWGPDDDDEELRGLPESLRAEMRRRDAPDDPHGGRYDDLLRVALRRRFVGVRNEYLAKRLASLGHDIEAVEGDVEALCTCPCCDFRTLSTRGGYEICPVCQWEDDGGREPDRLSSPNHMTLREGRSNFARFGASSERATLHVPSDGNERYERG